MVCLLSAEAKDGVCRLDFSARVLYSLAKEECVMASGEERGGPRVTQTIVKVILPLTMTQTASQTAVNGSGRVQVVVIVV